jgi:hypothetical protein
MVLTFAGVLTDLNDSQNKISDGLVPLYYFKTEIAELVLLP